MTWFAVGAAVVGVAGSVYSSGQAAKKQQGAADAATQLQRDQFDQTRSDNLPALEARNAALAQQQNLATKYGGGMPTSAQVMAEPGYQFGLTQGRNALEGSAAAAGGLYSGAAGKALVGYGNDYATGKYDQSFNRLQTAQTNDFNRWASIAGQGQTGANQLATAGQNYANNAGQIGMSNANAQGAAGIAQANALQSGLNQGVSWYNQRPQQASVTPTFDYSQGSGTGGEAYYSNEGRNYPAAQAWADGGPVRSEPKIGTRAPLRQGGTGGGLSDNALLLMLANQPQQPQAPQQPQQPYGVGALPANPLMNPRAIAEARARAAGAYAGGGPVYGPGGPQDDAIPVSLDDGSMGHLSNGEHVMNAPVVDAIGGGSNRLGQMRLNRLRMQLQQGAR